MREIHLSSTGSVGTDSCDWTMVTIKLYRHTRLATMSLALVLTVGYNELSSNSLYLVRQTLFTANNELVYIIRRERERSHSHLLSPTTSQLKTLLKGTVNERTQTHTGIPEVGRDYRDSRSKVDHQLRLI